MSEPVRFHVVVTQGALGGYSLGDVWPTCPKCNRPLYGDLVKAEGKLLHAECHDRGEP